MFFNIMKFLQKQYKMYKILESLMLCVLETWITKNDLKHTTQKVLSLNIK